jgi:hypothetical protein
MLTQARLKELLSYSPVTGLFTRRVITCNKVRIGDIAGTVDKSGYIHIRVEGKIYKAHRLAWLYTQGQMPPNMIDHINGIKDDNRLVNIRLATRSQNLGNSKIRLNSISGLKGVSWVGMRGKWRARINIEGNGKHLGMFKCKHEAHEAYRQAANKYFGEFANYGKKNDR